MHINIYILFVLIKFFIAEQPYKLQQHRIYRFQLGGICQIGLHIYANNNIGSHLSCHIYRKIIHNSPIYKHFTIYRNRCKEARNSHTCTHCKRQMTVILSLHEIDLDLSGRSCDIEAAAPVSPDSRSKS